MKVRPTFLRRTAIVVALVVAYFLTWGPTKKHAAHLTLNSENNLRVVTSSGSPAPLVVYCDEYTADSSTKVIGIKRRYYLWLGGPMIPPVSKAETTMVWLVAITTMVIGTLGFAWSTNRIQTSGFAFSIILYFSVARLILLIVQ